ncbi:MAG: hypothetical protein ACM3YF_06875 [Candidatus Zixiibacteriota bacterium]
MKSNDLGGNKRALSFLIFVLGSLVNAEHLLCDQMYEKFLFPYSENLAPVLKKTVGIFTINSHPETVKKGTKLRIYVREGKEFIYSKTLKVFEETIPISSCGYQSWAERRIIQYFRYPITDRSGKFLQICYDQVQQLEAWVDLEEVGLEFETSIIKLDSIQTPSTFFVDIFHFSPGGRCKIYSRPNGHSGVKSLSKNNPKYFVFRILELKRGYAKIAAVLGMGNGEEPRETLGWIKLRDEHGVLLIWVMCADLC